MTDCRLTDRVMAVLLAGGLAVLPASGTLAEASAGGLPVSVSGQIAAAALAGRRDLLAAVRRMVADHPDRVAEIVAEALRQAPDARADIEAAVAGAVSPDGGPWSGPEATEAPGKVDRPDAPATGAAPPANRSPHTSPDHGTAHGPDHDDGGRWTVSPLVPGGVAVAGLAGIAALALRGGGDSSSQPVPRLAPSRPVPPPPPETGPARQKPGLKPGTAASFETPEYRGQTGLAAINASTAYATGASGAGIRIAIFDTGVDVTHKDLAPGIVEGGYDIVARTPKVTDRGGHGTSVAGIAAGRRNGEDGHGVAFGADILPFGLAGRHGGLDIPGIPEAYDRAIRGRARIINHSYGTLAPGTTDRRSLVGNFFPPALPKVRAAVRQGIVQVFATGNTGLSRPSVQSLLPTVEPGLRWHWVAVTADGGTASHCGVAAAWCITAPGVGLKTAKTGGGTRDFGGTSAAAPMVSGALAVLMELFPDLTPAQIVQRMFRTANNRGRFADRARYGHGMLDLGAASRPHGRMTAALGAHLDGPARRPMDRSRVRLAPAFGDGLRVALDRETLTVFDSLDTPFTVPLAPFIAAAGQDFDMDAALGRFAMRRDGEPVRFGDIRVRVTPLPDRPLSDRASGGSSGDRDSRARLSIDLSMDLSGAVSGVTASAHVNRSPALAFGLPAMGAVQPGETLAADAFVAPWSELAARGVNAGAKARLRDGLDLTVHAFTGESGPGRTGHPARAHGVAAALGVDLGRYGHYEWQAGALVERDTVLGSRSTGAFARHAGARTGFTGLSARIPLIPDRLVVIGSAWLGVTRASVDGASLFSGLSPIRSEAFSIGVVGEGIVGEDDRLGFLVNQPLRVASGTASLDLARGRDRSKRVRRQTVQADLAPSGREIDYEIFYNTPLGPQASLGLSAMLRTQPGHNAKAKNEALLITRWQYQF